jgi:tetratricopeptide (TPR) repeat protein
VKLKKTIVVSLMALLIIPAIVLGAVLIVSHEPIKDEDPRVHFVAGNFFFYEENYASAIAEYEKAVSLKPDYKEALSNLAISYNKVGEFEKAAATLRKLVELDPSNANNHYDLAVDIVMTIQKDNDGTIEEVEEAITHFEASNGLANAKENIAFLEDMRSQYYAQQ